MVEVEMSSDIRKYKPKMIGNLTARQCISIVIGACMGVIPALLVPLGIIGKLVVGVCFAVPAIICGFVQIGGLPFEQLFLRKIYRSFLTPKKRKYKRSATIEILLKEQKKKEEMAYLNTLSKEKQKAYLKAKENKTITYSTDKRYAIYT